MQETPKALRLQIGLFGRTNVGKSSFLNCIANQNISIVSDIAGTTTDVVEKSMELLPFGPVTFLDTAGLDDNSVLAEARINKTKKIFNRADIIVLICEADKWGENEEYVRIQSENLKIPLIIIINKIDINPPSEAFLKKIRLFSSALITASFIDLENAENLRNDFKKALIENSPKDYFSSNLLGDLLPSGSLAVFVIPIDLEAPKGRLILPQVQAIRDVLDNDSAVVVVKEKEYAEMLSRLNQAPNLVVCDSQVIARVVADTPENVKLTSFSILFSRLKGDLEEFIKGAIAIEKLQAGDKILVAEACTHHAIQDDIGRVKIPRWLLQYTGVALNIETFAGHDYPDNLEDYKLVIHCGGCMINRKEMMSRLRQCKLANVPITNYGICISVLQGVLRRALSPFPELYELYMK